MCFNLNSLTIWNDRKRQICDSYSCVFLRWKDLCSHEDLLHQFRQDVEEMRQVQVHVLVLLQFRRVQLGGGGGGIQEKLFKSDVWSLQDLQNGMICAELVILLWRHRTMYHRNTWVNLRPPSLYLAGLFALHNLEDGIFEGVVDKWCRRGLHVLLHQCAG